MRTFGLIAVIFTVAICMTTGLNGQVTSNISEAVTTSPALSLDAVVWEVLTNNPSLKAANESWEAMEQRIPQARAWADPRLGFDQRAARFVDVPANSFPDSRLMVEQKLPLAGKNRLQGDAATADAASAFEELRRKQLDVVAKARAAYYRLANAYKQLELNRKNSDLLKQFAEISRAKLAAGNKSQGDVLTADTELAKLDEPQIELQREISEARTELNNLKNHPPESPLAQPSDLSFQPRWTFPWHIWRAWRWPIVPSWPLPGEKSRPPRPGSRPRTWNGFPNPACGLRGTATTRPARW